jgi:hypothetical protein
MDAKTDAASSIKSQGRQLALQRCQEMFSESDRWYLELVKHLALVNSAGLAGVCAIYASDSKAAQLFATYPAILCFAGGLLLAVLVMRITSASTQLRATVMLNRIKRLDLGEIAIDQVFQPIGDGLTTLRVARWLSMAALASFVIGAWPFLRLAIK